VRTNKQTEDISNAREDYLRAIYILQLESGEASVTRIATRLGLSKSTVSERIKDLAEAGFVKADPYSAIVLTKTGEQLGEKLTYKHRVIEVFLNSVLNMPKSKVHAEAEKLEHAMSDEVIQRLAKFLNNPTTDPHGSEIPTIKNWN
jgi:DtxR family Mn-dependent transcriptional regulator